jgi:DnaJ-domain-containing protein 1
MIAAINTSQWSVTVQSRKKEKEARVSRIEFLIALLQLQLELDIPAHTGYIVNKRLVQLTITSTT